MLNPTWLNTFMTLAETGHFTKTAEKLFMTQPGVSQHIVKLEQHCGYSLISRENKQFELTEQGRLVYQYAKSLKSNEKALFEQLSFDDPHSGECSLSCSGALALVLYPKLLDIQTNYPELVIKLKSSPNHQIINDVQQGFTDIGLVTHIPNPSLFDVVELGKEALCLVFPQQYEKVDLPTLQKLGLINHPDAEHYLSLYVEHHNDKHRDNINISEIPIRGFINQISQILEPVAKGIGFTVLPKSAIDSFNKQDKLTILKIEQQIMEPVYLVKKRNRALPARFNAIETLLKTHFN